MLDRGVLRLTLAAFGLAAGIAGLALAGVMAPADNWLKDRRFDLTTVAPTGNYLFVDIDGASLQQVGVWPWSRSHYAELLTRLLGAGADEVAFDIDFSSASAPAGDAAFAAALEDAGGYATLAAFEQAGTNGVTVNMPLEYFRSLAEIATVNISVDPDGLLRSAESGRVIEGEAYPSLSAALGGRGADAAIFGIDFAIDPAGIARLSAADILSGQFDAAQVAGRKVLIGASAIELRDLFAVPRHGVLPGALIQLLAADTLAQHREMRQAPWWVAPLVALLIGAMLLPFRQRLGVAMAVAIGLMAFIEALAVGAHISLHLQLATIAPHLSILAVLALIAGVELEARRRGRRAAEAQRDAVQHILDRVISDNFEGILVVGANGAILSASALAADLFGTEAHRLNDLPEALQTAFRQVIAAGESQVWPETAQISTQLGRRDVEYLVSLSGMGGEMEQGGLMACMSFRDVTEQLAREEQMRFLSRHDQLTGALQRHELVARLGARAGQSMALFAFDLAGMRTVNDTLGRHVGDSVLQQVVLRLTALGLEEVTRLGGNQFAAIRSGGIAPADLQQLGKELLDELARPMACGGVAPIVHARIGITSTSRSGNDAETLLRHADMALSLASRTWTEPLVVFAPHMEQTIGHNRAIEAELRSALEDGSITVQFQPQVSLPSGSLSGAEALVRWQRDGRSVPPQLFVRIAETSGSIVQLGRVMRTKALGVAATWPSHMRIGLNVSPLEFQSDDVARRVLSEAEICGIDPRRIDIEITEGLLLDASSEIVDTLNRLRGEGVRVALDDFGTGFSSLRALADLPIDTLKLDRSFITGLPDDRDSLAIVSAVLRMSHDLGREVLAEGVETVAQAQCLASMGCRLAQGYLYGKAMSAIAIGQMIAAPPLAKAG